MGFIIRQVFATWKVLLVIPFAGESVPHLVQLNLTLARWCWHPGTMAIYLLRPQSWSHDQDCICCHVYSFHVHIGGLQPCHPCFLKKVMSMTTMFSTKVHMDVPPGINIYAKTGYWKGEGFHVMCEICTCKLLGMIHKEPILVKLFDLQPIWKTKLNRHLSKWSCNGQVLNGEICCESIQSMGNQFINTCKCSGLAVQPHHCQVLV